jgi:predicted transcriptional regulator
MVRQDPITAEQAAEDEAFIQAVKAGQASLDAGQSVPYEDVRRWLLSWGSDQETPPPECP